MLTLIVPCLVFSFILLGWGVFFSKLLKTEITIGLFNATAFCALSAFLGFIYSIPQITAITLLGLGGLFIIRFLFYEYTRPNKAILLKKPNYFIIGYFVLLSLCFIFNYGMKFRSIDDYSFWGVMSKYLYVFNALPDNDHYINAKFLTYTPVLASFHYLLYTLGQHYSQFWGYFAQGFIFISAALVLFDPKDKSRTIVNLSLMTVLFFMAYGSVLARMEVDAYVAAYFFIMVWIIYNKESEALHLIGIPLLFLSVIKEIGLLFSLFSLLLYLVLERPKGIMRIKCFILLLAIFSIKLIWKQHVLRYGFHGFAANISLNSAISTLNPFNVYYNTAQYLYLKELLFSKYDHLIQLPYLVVYMIIAGAWYYPVKNYPQSKIRIHKTMSLFIIYSITYLLLLFFLQAIVFQVGHGNEKILDFTRYYNMLFLPWLAIILFINLDVMKPQYSPISKKATALSLSIALVIVAGGKIERMRKFYQPKDLYSLYALIEKNTSQLTNKNWSLCLNNPPEPTYEVTMPLTYFFMPHSVHDITKSLAKIDCDLVLNWNNKQLVFTKTKRQLT